MSKRNIFLTENQISEIKSLLKEDRESKAQKEGIKYLISRGKSSEEANTIYNHIREHMPLVRLPRYTNENGREKDTYTFLKGVCRLYIDKELDTDLKESRMNQILKYLVSDEFIDDYDEMLNGLSFDELYDRFAGRIQKDIEDERQKSAGKERIANTDYQIIKIPDYETAEQYGQYTSWCVTHYPQMYDHYTHKSLGLFYFCLKNGFQDVQPVRGEGCPLDEYGLSMIAVSINVDGTPNTITCRWNHDNGGNDNIMSPSQLEDLLGVNYYNTFLPRTKEELQSKGVITFDMVPELLANGDKSLFSICSYHEPLGNNGLFKIKLHNKYNVVSMENRQLLYDTWFDFFGKTKDGVFSVGLRGDFNFINQTGQLLSNEWFQSVSDFQGGFGGIKKNGKWSFIKQDGQQLTDLWFKKCWSFKNGAALVWDAQKYNWLNQQGALISPNMWFDDASEFTSKGIANGSIINKDAEEEEDEFGLPSLSGGEDDVENYTVFLNGKIRQEMFEDTKSARTIFLTENQFNEIQQKLKQARQDTNIHPTEKQKHAGNYKMGRISVLGYDIVLENPKGSYRCGKDSNGKEWKTLMHNDYGYFAHTLAVDGDAVDVFLGTHFDTYSVFVIDQVINGKYDESKVMLGFRNEQEARDAYLSNYEPGWNGIGKITEVTHDVFKDWLYDGYKHRKPFSEYKTIQKKKLNEETYTVYHGSPSREIVTGKFRKGSHGVLGPGMYFSEEKEYTTRYAKKFGSGAIYKAEIDIYKPLILTSSNPTEEFLTRIYNTPKVYLRRANMQSNDNYIVESKDIKKMFSLGFDGIIWEYAQNREFVVYDKSQIKIIEKEDI